MDWETTEGIVALLQRILRERDELARAPTDYSTQAQLHRHELRQRIDDTLTQLQELLRVKTDWAARFSNATLTSNLHKLTHALPADADRTRIAHALNLFVDAFERYDTEQRVYIHLSGVILEIPELTLGPVQLVAMDQARVEAELRSMNQYFEALQAPMNTQEEARRENERQSYRVIFPGLRRVDDGDRPTYAIFKMVGDSSTARRRALGAVEDVIDLLRYAIQFIAPGMHGLSIGIAGQHSAGSIVVTCVPSNYAIPRLSMDQRHAIHGMEITQADVQVMEAEGLFELSALLTKPDLSKFEKAVLRAIHWWADSTTYFSNDNSFLSLMMCLEALFTQRSDSSIRNSVAEGVAAVLYSIQSQREYVKGRVRELYSMRSAISHGGRTEITDEALNELQRYCRDVLRWATNELEHFDSPGGVATWVQARWAKSSQEP